RSTAAGLTDRAGAPRPGLLGTDAVVGALAPAGKLDAAVVGVGNTALPRRAELFRLLYDCGLATQALVHPRAVLARSSRIGDGSVVFGGCVLGAGVEVGVNGVGYSGVIVEDDCRIADHRHPAAGVLLPGPVTIEWGGLLRS